MSCQDLSGTLDMSNFPIRVASQRRASSLINSLERVAADYCPRRPFSPFPPFLVPVVNGASLARSSPLHGEFPLVAARIADRLCYFFILPSVRTLDGMTPYFCAEALGYRSGSNIGTVGSTLLLVMIKISKRQGPSIDD